VHARKLPVRSISVERTVYGLLWSLFCVYWQYQAVKGNGLNTLVSFALLTRNLATKGSLHLAMDPGQSNEFNLKKSIVMRFNVQSLKSIEAPPVLLDMGVIVVTCLLCLLSLLYLFVDVCRLCTLYFIFLYMRVCPGKELSNRYVLISQSINFF